MHKECYDTSDFSQHYNAVRGLIAPDVTAEHIPDDYLSQQPFAPDAERRGSQTPERCGALMWTR